MKLALISEIHANLEALQATLDDIAPHWSIASSVSATSSDTIRNLKNASRFFAKCRRFASQATTTAPFAGRLRPKPSTIPPRAPCYPDPLLLGFLQETYDAAANLANWDRKALERATQRARPQADFHPPPQSGGG